MHNTTESILVVEHQPQYYHNIQINYINVGPTAGDIPGSASG